MSKEGKHAGDDVDAHWDEASPTNFFSLALYAVLGFMIILGIVVGLVILLG